MTTPVTVTRSLKTKASRFARIDNEALQNKALSFRARGLLAYVLSRPKNWQHSAQRFACESNDGVHAVRGAMRELEVNGYATLQKVRGKDGTMRHRWVFREAPSIEKPHTVETQPSIENQHTAPSTGLPSDGSPKRGAPRDGSPRDGSPRDGKPALLETTGSETTVIETTDKETTVEREPNDAPPLQGNSFFSLDPIRDQVCKEFYISPEGAIEAFRVFRQTKLQFPADDRSADAFCGWLRSTKQGKRLVEKYALETRWDGNPLYREVKACQPMEGDAFPSDPPPPARAIDEEPAGWREWAKDDPYLDRALIGMPWRDLSDNTRRGIVRKHTERMEKLGIRVGDNMRVPFAR